MTTLLSTLLDVDRLLASPDVQLLLVDRDSSDFKSPLFCRRHVACKRLFGKSSRDGAALKAALAAHPSALLGIAPTRSLMILDFDSWDAIDDIVMATGIDLNRHVRVYTSRGVHLYLHVADAPTRIIKPHAKIDVRYGPMQYVLAPGAVRADGGTYELVGSWGDWQPEPKLLELVTAQTQLQPLVPSTDSVERGRGKELTSAPEQALALITRLNQLQHDYAVDAHWSARLEDRSTSGTLCSVWNVTYALGLTVAQAVELVTTTRHPLAIKAWSGARSPGWVAADCARVYGKQRVVGWTAYSADATRARLVTQLGDQHRLIAVLDWIIARVNRVQDPQVGIGVQQLADAFSVSKVAASKWLKRLVELDVLTLVEVHVWRSANPRANRVREYAVVGLESAVAGPERR